MSDCPFTGASLLDLLDAEGRPIGEQASPAYQRCTIEERVLRFGDARDASGKPANVAALRQLQSGWRPLLRRLGSLEPDAPVTVGRMRRRASLATFFAPWAALEGRPPSALDSAAFKVALGFRKLLTSALLRGHLAPDEPPPGRDWLAAYLAAPAPDEASWLEGPSQVCAGSQAQIVAAWEALAGRIEPLPLCRRLIDGWARWDAQAAVEAAALAAATALFEGPWGTAALAQAIESASPLPWVQVARGVSPFATLALFESGQAPALLQEFLSELAEPSSGAAARLCGRLAAMGRP